MTAAQSDTDTQGQTAADAYQAGPAQVAETAGETVFPPFDASTFTSQLFWLAISFVLLYVLLSRFVLPRIGSAIEERRDRIADDIDAAQQMKTQAEETAQAYEKALADARAKAQALAAEAKADADKEIAAEIDELDRELDARQAEADARIREARDKALEEVKSIAIGAASAVTEQLAGLEVSEADAKKAVNASDKEAGR